MVQPEYNAISAIQGRDARGVVMQPVILVKLPNAPRFCGTFDTTNFKEWWLSEPLPGDVAEIIDSEWAYGQYHLALCRMVDGTYSIYQSRDYGKTWHEVFNTNNTLYNLIQIDPGWVLCSASNGWYHTTNSGTDWTLRSTQAPGCREVINLGDDTLIAHDGMNIWKSVDVGEHWSKKLNGRSFTIKLSHGGTRNVGWGLDGYPALDGYGNRVFAGIGGYFVVSDDAAESWTMPYFYSPHTNVRILQILNTNPSVSGPEHTYMIRIYLTNLGVVRHYYAANPMRPWTARFDQPFSGYENGRLTAYHVLRPGSNTYDQVVFSSQMRFNTSRQTYEPAVKYSLDGGWTWVDLDISKIKVYEGDPGQGSFTFGGPFLVDVFTKFAWTGNPCHNSGSWSELKGAYVRGISSDHDFLATVAKNRNYYGDIINQATFDMNLNTSILSTKEFNLLGDFDLLSKTTFNLRFFGKPLLKANFDRGITGNMTCVFARNHDHPVNMLSKRTHWRPIDSDILCQGVSSKGFPLNIVIVDSKFDELLVGTERYMPQLFELWSKMLKYDVYSSR